MKSVKLLVALFLLTSFGCATKFIMLSRSKPEYKVAYVTCRLPGRCLGGMKGRKLTTCMGEQKVLVKISKVSGYYVDEPHVTRTSPKFKIVDYLTRCK